MTMAITRQAVPAKPLVVVPARAAGEAPRLDRKCSDCTPEVEDVSELQRKLASGAAPAHGHSFGGVAVVAPTPAGPATMEISEPGDPAEQEAEQAAERVMARLSSGAPPDGGPPALSVAQPRVQRAPDEPAASPPQAASAGFLVDDEATILPGQMRKTEFLGALRPALCAAADRELARAGRNTDGCPYLDRWFAYYQGRDAQHVERSLRKYAPETASASSARDYIAPISERVAQGVHRWVDTGEVPELPDGVSPDMLGDGGGVLGALSSVGSAIASGLSAIGSFFSNLFFKANAGGAARGVDRSALDARLGAGQPLDGAARSRMGSAFGHDFSAVRIHADPSSAALAEGLNARAFTLGTHIAFGAGQYRPGELVGDALLAHELAHVVQQSGGEPARAAPVRDDADPSLEADADAAAEGALIELWGDRHGAPGRRKQARPRISTALRLQRCPGAARQTGVPAAQSEVPDLPNDVVARIRPAVASQDAGVRQAALDALVAWGRTSPSIGVDWNRIASVTYDTAPGAQGSHTELADLRQIRMYIGPVAFVSAADLYATFRHELVHVVQANDDNYAATQRRGTGWREVDAYLWQLEHASGLGLLARDRWGVENGQANVEVGLARVVDGLFRSDDSMGHQRHDNPSIISDAEWRALGRRMGSALLGIPWEVVHAVRPELPRQMVEDLAAGRLSR